MSDNLKKVLILEDKLGEYLENNNLDILTVDRKSEEYVKITDEIAKLVDHLNNDELIYLLNNGTLIHDVLDVANYFKKYKVNKKKLKEDNTYKEAFKKLNSFVERICDASLSDEELVTAHLSYEGDVDGVSEYLLKNMENQDIMELSKETDDWNYKLFLFSKFKA